jgi:hypothetical protein
VSTAKSTKRSPRLVIDVPQDIIETSTERDSSHCMIADAIARAVPQAKYISVDLATIRFTDLDAGVRYIYLTPRPAQAALLAFDQGEKPEPFKLRLEGAHVLATGNARKARATLQQDPRGGKTPPVRVGGQSPPLGPLQGGAKLDNARKTPVVRTGRRREFGLRAIIR